LAHRAFGIMSRLARIKQGSALMAALRGDTPQCSIKTL
jgi:hypothetical protein